MDPPSPPPANAPGSPNHDLHPERAALKRRRSESISEDVSVIKTNDDATECKRSAVHAGYWKDPFVQHFCPEYTRKDPEIHLGYYARVRSIRMVVEKFLKVAGESAQIVNLGSGFDTLFWQLISEGAQFSTFVDVDFSSVTSKKISHIMKPSGHTLKQAIVAGSEQPQVVGRHSLRTANHKYSLVAADLRQLHELQAVLAGELCCGLDRSRPTLLLCECVLVYMAVEQGNDLLAALSQHFTNAAFLSYGMVNLNDTFGRVMLENLRTRGISLAGVPACECTDTLEQRFKSNGWPSARALTMQDVYEHHLPPNDRLRAEQLEQLDERELLMQLLQHYSLTFAATQHSVASLHNCFFPFTPA